MSASGTWLVRGGRSVAYWLGWWLLYVLATILVGACVGALVVPGVGLLWGADFSLGHMLSKGFVNGARYGGVWAGGMGVVLCVRRAWLMRRRG